LTGESEEKTVDWSHDDLRPKIPPVSDEASTQRFAPPSKFDGALGNCITLARPGDVEDFIRRWHRAQMRQWAGQWRVVHHDAAELGQPVEYLAEATVQIAMLYRDSADGANGSS